MIRKLAAVSLLLALVACKKEEPAPTQVNVVPPEPAPTTAATTPPAEPAVDLDTLAVEEDFEEEAEKEITAANLEKKVAELEKEMSVD